MGSTSLAGPAVPGLRSNDCRAHQPGESQLTQARPTVRRAEWADHPDEGDSMNRVPDSELVGVPGGTLITADANEGRALAFTPGADARQNSHPSPAALIGVRQRGS